MAGRHTSASLRSPTCRRREAGIGRCGARCRRRWCSDCSRRRLGVGANRNRWARWNPGARFGLPAFGWGEVRRIGWGRCSLVRCLSRICCTCLQCNGWAVISRGWGNSPPWRHTSAGFGLPAGGWREASIVRHRFGDRIRSCLGDDCRSRGLWCACTSPVSDSRECAREVRRQTTTLGKDLRVHNQHQPFASHLFGAARSDEFYNGLIQASRGPFPTKHIDCGQRADRRIRVGIKPATHRLLGVRATPGRPVVSTFVVRIRTSDGVRNIVLKHVGSSFGVTTIRCRVVRPNRAVAVYDLDTSRGLDRCKPLLVPGTVLSVITDVVLVDG